MSLSITKIVRCLLAASLLLCFTISYAQDKYAKLSLRIDSLANIGLPKSALKEVDKLDALARADNNIAQQVRAVIYRMTFQSYLEEDALVAIITRLKADIDKAEFPVKPVLQSLLAQMYWEYYKENRYRFGQRTKLEKQDVDFRNWDTQTVINETSRMYALSLQDVVKEQNTSVGVLDGVLEGDKETRYLRPTLYDLLVHRAFDFYLSDEASINKPRLPFTLNDPRFFSDSRAFAGLDIKTTDTASTLYKGIKYLQQATLFHLEKNNREALADIDIKRLGVLFRQSSVAGKDSLYIKALRRVADNLSTSPINADALVLIGTYYKDQDSLTTAYSYFKKAVTMYPKSRGGETAAASIINIRQPTLSVSVENVNVPGKPLLGLVSYSNVKEAKVSIYYLSPAQIQQLTGKSSLIDQFYLGAADKIIKFLKPLRPVQERRLLLPGINDYRKHSAEFKIDSLPVGRYVTVISNVQSKSRYLSQSTNFRITSLSYVARALPGGQTELRIVNRDSGAPLQGVKVVIYRSDYVKNKNVKNVAFSGLSDINGRYLFKGKNGEQYNFILSYKNDNYVEEERDFYNSETIETSSKPVISTILFTDRQLYRPGQTIYFKGLHITTTDGKNAIVPGEDVKVSLQDMNNKILTELTLKSNEFGSVQGSFVIPQNIANGQVSIVAVNGRAFVRVEEYKRPTFQVTFSPVNALYRPGDSVKIKGRVMAFSGYGISNAKVAYHVTSRVMPVYDERFTKSRNIGSVWSRNGEVAADTIQTNDKGEFETRFKALGDTVTVAARAFDYSDIYMVNADVTDASGETQTAATSIIISSKVLDIDVTVPAKWSAKDSALIPVRLNNANGQPQKGTVTIKVFALKQPQQFTKDRVWQYPDQFMLTRDEFKKTFPAYPWKQETDPAGLEVLNKLSEVNITADSTMGMLDLGVLKKQANGVYKIVINARSDNGDITSMTKFVKVVNGPTPVCDTEDWQLFTTVKPGESLEYLIGTDKPSHVLMEKFDGARLLSSEWITLSGPYQQTIKVPVPTTNQNSFGVQFLTMSDNRMHIFYNQIKVRDTVKKLPIRFITFRNKLQPGEKERWKLQIAGTDEKNAAEMLGALYDASLDDIAPAQYWQTDYGYYLPYTRDYFIWIRTQLAEETTAEWIDRDEDTPGYSLDINYERLNLFGYDYFGGDNGGYNSYLEQVKENLANLKADKTLAAEYFKNAALVKSGYDVSGKTMFNRHTLPGVKISIKNIGISTRSNSKGYFKIKVPVNGILVFSSPPFPKKEIKTKAASQLTVQMGRGNNGPVIEELKVADPGQKSKGGVAMMYDELYDPNLRAMVSASKVRTASFGNASPASDMEVREPNINKALAGKVAGVQVRSQSAAPLGMPVPIIPRKNFNETAFFYPQLHTDEKGQILIDFTIPEALTRWKFRGFAHNKDLQTGYVENEVITQKQLSISANMPRFLREGDTVSVSARLANLTDKTLKGTVKMQLFNALNMQPVNLFANKADGEQTFEVVANTNKAVTFILVIPAGLDALTYRLTADAGQFTDGEENTLPVLPNRTLVTESMPMMVRAGQTRSFTFDKLVKQSSKTLQNKTLTLEYTQNPAWYAVQALPYMMEFPYECAEQTFSRYYANSLATNLVNKMPAIKQVFDQWKAGSSTALLSNLEKDQELKATLIEETPWLQDAVSETDQKKRIALLFDLNKMSDELRMNLDKLQKKQLPDGGFPWFGGDRADRFITQHILQGIGELHHLNIGNDAGLEPMTTNALNYMDRQLIADDKLLKKDKDYANRPINDMEIQAWFTRSYFLNNTIDAPVQKLLTDYLNRASTQWTTQNVYEQGMIALTMQRYKKPAVTQQIEKSLLETAQQSEEMGMYWAKNQRDYFWYEAPIETQSLLIELFTEAGNNTKAVDEMKIWLLRNKQTNNWKTTTATAAACYALLLKGDDILATTGTSTIKLNGKLLEELKPGVKADAGNGYLKTSWADEQVKPSLGKIEIQNASTNTTWGAMHWQYLENLDKIASAQTNIQLVRKYYIQKQGDTGPVLVAVDATHQPKTGDLLKVVINLKADRDFEYVQLKDLRPAGTEPVEALSTYKYQDGLYYYQVTKDVATNFFISYLNKGNYVFEYQLRVAQPGNFSTGITSIQSMYAPEFNSHSEGGRMGIGH
ncbi:alpha-2-macroglobulin family protein [Mucilaginibacter sp.]|uniref:alpha-2-macroglobulin family protein n=1 Tax=Mucilaginibacter sp. TaxID=1882438 RepID=UPI0025D33594|nr:alpha-2-macroglobulin family protein [Mucilaginibacter sp.]